MGGDQPKKDAPPEQGERKSRRWVLVVLFSGVLWCAAAVQLHTWLPKRNWRMNVDAIDEGAGLAQSVHTLCESEEGREFLEEKRAELEGQRARLLALAFHSYCPELGEEPLDTPELGAERAEQMFARFQASESSAEKQRLAKGVLNEPQSLDPSALREVLRWQVQQEVPLESVLDAGTLRDDAILPLLIEELGLTEDSLSGAHLSSALASLWEELPQEARRRLAAEWVAVRWIVHDSGAVGEPQPMRIEVEYAPPSAFAACKLRLVVVVTEIKINGELAEQGGAPLSGAFEPLVLDEPGVRWAEVDLSSFFPEHGKNTLSLHHEWLLVPQEVGLADLGELEKFEALAVVSGRGGGDDLPYREFLGVDKGLPKTLHDTELDQWVMSAMDVSITAGGSEIPLRQGGAGVATRPAVAVGLDAQVAPFLKLGSTNWPETTFALRFQAQLLPRGEWVDVGEGIVLGGADTTARYTSRRFDLDFAPVLSDTMVGTLALRARASLRVARTHPKVNAYWGENIDLGQLEVENLTPRQGSHWRAAQRAIEQRP